MILDEFIRDRRIEGSLLETLHALKTSDPAALQSLIDELRPSANTLRELLRLSREIGFRDGISLGQIVVLPEIVKHLLDENLSSKDKQRLIRRELELIRYPEKSRIQRALDETVKEIRSEFGVSPILPQDLEGDSVSFELSIKNPEQLRSLTEKLWALAESKHLERLFSLMFGELL